MEYNAYLIVLMSLPLLAQWGAGWRGAVAATLGALAFVAAVYISIPADGGFEVANVYLNAPADAVAGHAPADWNPEAKAERRMAAAYMLLVVLLHRPAAAVLTGAVLAGAWAALHSGIRRLNLGMPAADGAAAAGRAVAASRLAPVLLRAGLAAVLIAAGFVWVLDTMYEATFAAPKLAGWLFDRAAAAFRTF